MDKLFKSSANPDQVSTSVVGTIIMVLSLLVPDFDWTSTVGSIAEGVVAITKQFTLIAGGFITAFGLVRKVLIELKGIIAFLKETFVSK